MGQRRREWRMESSGRVRDEMKSCLERDERDGEEEELTKRVKEKEMWSQETRDGLIFPQHSFHPIQRAVNRQ